MMPPRSERLDPREFGLPSRTILEKRNDEIAIVIRRKSRIIMADGKKIAGKAALLRRSFPQAAIVVRTNTPVCSKTVKFLKEQGIDLAGDA